MSKGYVLFNRVFVYFTNPVLDLLELYLAGSDRIIEPISYLQVTKLKQKGQRKLAIGGIAENWGFLPPISLLMGSQEPCQMASHSV